MSFEEPLSSESPGGLPWLCPCGSLRPLRRCCLLDLPFSDVGGKGGGLRPCFPTLRTHTCNFKEWPSGGGGVQLTFPWLQKSYSGALQCWALEAERWLPVPALPPCDLGQVIRWTSVNLSFFFCKMRVVLSGLKSISVRSR